MAMQFPPKLLGERSDNDTQFMAMAKDNQDMILIGGAVIVLGLLYFAYTLIFPSQRVGTWRYGICRVFLEQYSTYPTELKVLTAAEKQSSVQMGYITTNSFGTQQSELMECFYKMTQRGPIIDRVTIDRKPLFFERNKREKPKVDTAVNTQDKPITHNDILNLYQQDASLTIQNFNIDQFNASIPAILSGEDMDLVLPSNFPKNIEDLKYD